MRHSGAEKTEAPQKPADGPGDETASTSQAELDAVTAERDQYLEQAQRALADLANYRRRVEQERGVAREIATRSLLSQLTPIIDDLHRALGSAPEDEKSSSWFQGVQMIEKKLMAVLEREGVTPIDALGKPFDPALHEAVATEEGSTQNVVVEVYQTGYKHGQSLLRPAMVKVGDKSELQA